MEGDLEGVESGFPAIGPALTTGDGSLIVTTLAGRITSPVTLPVATSNAPNRLTVPCRT